MSLLDTINYQFKGITDAIGTAINATVNSTNISYGFIGVSTAILGYYTFFENDIEKTAEQPKVQQPEAQQPEPEAQQPEPEAQQPEVQKQPEAQPVISGGKKKKRHTRKLF